MLIELLVFAGLGYVAQDVAFNKLTEPKYRVNEGDIMWHYELMRTNTLYAANFDNHSPKYRHPASGVTRQDVANYEANKSDS